MTRGPKPKPSALKLIQGNPGKRRINKNEPKPKAVRRPRPPIELDDYAKKEWRRVVLELETLGILSKLDLPVLTAYCIAYSRFRFANEALKAVADKDKTLHGLLIKTKQGNWIQNPLVGVARRAANDMTRLALEFGMTPSSRTRLEVREPNEFNEFAEF